MSTVLHQKRLGQNGVSLMGSKTAQLRYTTLLKYVKSMEGIMGAHVKSKTSLIGERLMAVVGVDKNNRPDDFPALAHLKTKLSQLKQKMRRERGG